ncbi:hypothetical protein IBT50_25455 [Bacillus sp. S70]|uniref:hypothetical protein n=1 Tax=unclassified Bacillus (in: firmicutes) TaxID=185979 RepID=UPI0019096AD4|nr:MULTISPECIES: hypothetical protein [unclassified Bacillus (in: firmicutes)]MBJ9983544.1 hypothetical protein [Bacillus sp. S29]MBK0104710.1 hypothetical protein [Bacillus sp. S70]MBK0110056.1 hypothetical protein [Bacillus sp. S73]MBK0138837.1 hypothetical protein [Bacillus sp. S72]MBK0148027.1 hypothetical protein [Bacillus sp. S74]
MGISKAMSELRSTRLTMYNDTKWVLEMVKELRKENIELFTTKEAMIDEMQSVLESLLETINN